MAFDGAYLYTVKHEIEPLVNARVDKIHQPSKDEVILHLRSREGLSRLLISTAGDSARIHLTEVSIENPAAPPMFCMLLRKHLGGGKLIAVRQDGLERILFLDFECINELGDRVQLTLACEVMGRYSNLILVNQDGKVIDSLKRNADVTRERVLLPGFPYEMPHRSRRLNFLDAEDGTITSALLLAPDQNLDKALVSLFEGVSPLLAREWAYYVSRGENVRSHSLTQMQTERLLYTIHRTRQMLMEHTCQFHLLLTQDGALKDFIFLRPEQYGALMVVKPMPSASVTLDTFYAQRDLRARMKQRANDLFKLLMTRIERTARKLDNQKAELSETDKMERSKLFGDLLSANLYRLQKGDAQAVLENFYEADCPAVTIPLQVQLTPAQNAQRYYTLYRKAATAKEKLAEQIAQGEQELQYLESVFDVLSRAETESDLLLLREELIQQGYIRNRQKQKPPKQSPPMLYQSSDGFPILVGRNNRQNDQLTLKQAAKLDIWLHTQNIPGSHVILVTDGQEPSETALREAAVLAAYHSKARDSAQVPVDFTKVRFVKKPNGAKPGMVIFTNQQTLYVKPDAALCSHLEVKA